MNDELLRLMSNEFGKGSADLLDLLGLTNAQSPGEASNPPANASELARIFSLAPEAQRNAFVQQLQSMQAFGASQQAAPPPNNNIVAQIVGNSQHQLPPASAPTVPSLPISSSSLSSNNLPDPFASLGLNSGDWLGAIFNASGSLGPLNADQLSNLAAAAGPPPSHPQTLAKLPAKTATHALLPNTMMGHARTPTPPLDILAGASHGARPRRAAARAAVARTVAILKPMSEEEEDTPFADFIPTEGLPQPKPQGALPPRLEGPSSDGSDHAGDGDAKAAAGGANKRKVEEVDWRTVSDPEERKRLRRMAKNRRTAAASRQRKKAALEELTAERNAYKGQVEELQQQVVALQQQVVALQQQVVALQQQLGGGAS